MVTNWAADNKQFSLIFEENPLADFVELPDDGKAQDELWFSNMLCGILRGALEMVKYHPFLDEYISHTFTRLICLVPYSKCVRLMFSLYPLAGLAL